MENFDISLLEGSPKRAPVATAEEDATLDDAPVLGGVASCEGADAREITPDGSEPAAATPAATPEEPRVVIFRAWAFVLKSLDTLPDLRPELVPKNFSLLEEWIREYKHFEVSFSFHLFPCSTRFNRFT
jgi:hypothetical protein